MHEPEIWSLKCKALNKTGIIKIKSIIRLTADDILGFSIFAFFIKNYFPFYCSSSPIIFFSFEFLLTFNFFPIHILFSIWVLRERERERERG